MEKDVKHAEIDKAVFMGHSEVDIQGSFWFTFDDGKERLSVSELGARLPRSVRQLVIMTCCSTKFAAPFSNLPPHCAWINYGLWMARKFQLLLVNARSVWNCQFVGKPKLTRIWGYFYQYLKRNWSFLRRRHCLLSQARQRQCRRPHRQPLQHQRWICAASLHQSKK